MRRLLSLLIIGITVLPVIAIGAPKNNFIRTITGRVFSADGAPLAGASVTVKGTTVAASADNKGTFSIDIPDNIHNPVLMVSAVGYATREIAVNGTDHLDVHLEVDIKKLNDVVVVGYGTQKRKDLTGSIASVSGAQIEQRPVSSYADALAGTVPGIDIAPRS